MSLPSKIKIRIAATGDVHGEYMEGRLASAATWIRSQRSTLGRNFIYLDAGDLIQGGAAAYYANFILPTQSPLSAAPQHNSDLPGTSSHLSPTGDSATQVPALGPHPAAEMLNYLGCNAATIGNHDIEMGHSVWHWFARSCNAPILAANLTGEAESPLKPYTIVECGPQEAPIRIAILGMITEALDHWVPKENWRGLKCHHIAPTARKWIDHINNNYHPDAIIGLFHSGLKGGIQMKDEGVAENSTLHTATKVPGFSAIFYGHDHKINCHTIRNKVGEEVLLLNPGSHCQMMVYADLEFTRETPGGEKSTEPAHEQSGNCGGWYLSGGTARSLSLEDVEPDQTFLERFRWLRRAGEEYESQPITTLQKELHLKEIFSGPSEFMDLLHAAQLKATGAQISFASPLFIEEALHAGIVRRRDLYKLYRFENQLCTIAASGREIKNLLEYVYSEWVHQMHSKEDPMFQLSKPLNNNTPAWFKNIVWDFDTACGIDYNVDLRQPNGHRITINGLYQPQLQWLGKSRSPLSSTPANNSIAQCTGSQLERFAPQESTGSQLERFAPQESTGSQLEPFELDRIYTVVINSYRACGGGLLWTKGAGIPHAKLKERIITTTKEDIRTILAKQLSQQPLTPQLISRWRFLPEEWAQYHKPDLKW